MKSSLVLTVLLSLLVAKLCCAYCITEEQQMSSGMLTKKSSDPYKLPLSLLQRLHDGQGISYEALLRLSGKEEVNPQALASSQKRDMHDFFVGLMGKRTTEHGARLLFLRHGKPYGPSEQREFQPGDNPIDVNKGTLPGFGDMKYLPDAE